MMYIDEEMENGTRLACRQCHSALDSWNENLRLTYSDCCGVALCDQCIRESFLTAKEITCIGQCGNTAVSVHSFQKDNFDRQHFRLRKKKQRKANDVFVKRRDDFAALDAFNDYLELQEDIVYDLTYGSAAEATVAQTRLDAYASANRAEIAAVKERRRRDERAAAAVAAAPSAAAIAALREQQIAAQLLQQQQQQQQQQAGGAGVPQAAVFTGPAPLDASSAAALLSGDARAVRDAVRAAEKRRADGDVDRVALQTRRTQARRAGGFQLAVSQRRARAGVVAGLFHIPSSS
jgi:hypothetical protein